MLELRINFCKKRCRSKRIVFYFGKVVGVRLLSFGVGATDSLEYLPNCLDLKGFELILRSFSLKFN